MEGFSLQQQEAIEWATGQQPSSRFLRNIQSASNKDKEIAKEAIINAIINMCPTDISIAMANLLIAAIKALKPN